VLITSHGEVSAVTGGYVLLVEQGNQRAVLMFHVEHRARQRNRGKDSTLGHILTIGHCNHFIPLLAGRSAERPHILLVHRFGTLCWAVLRGHADPDGQRADTNTTAAILQKLGSRSYLVLL